MPSISVYYSSGRQDRPSCRIVFDWWRKYGKGGSLDGLRRKIRVQQIGILRASHGANGDVSVYEAHPDQNADGIKFSVMRDAVIQILMEE